MVTLLKQFGIRAKSSMVTLLKQSSCINRITESEHHNNPKFRVSDIRNQVRFLATGQWRHQPKEASVHQVIVGRGVVEQGRFRELDLMSCWDGAATAQGIESLKPRMKIKRCAVLPEPL